MATVSPTTALIMPTTPLLLLLRLVAPFPLLLAATRLLVAREALSTRFPPCLVPPLWPSKRLRVVLA